MSPALAPDLTDRRAAARRQPALGTVCRLASERDGTTALGLVWNISCAGISMLLNEPREPQCLIPGELETVTGFDHLAVTMEVVHVKKLETGDYFIGAQFLRPLTADELGPFAAG